MEALCPDCNDELTPSIVGYLCHNCGSVHQFDRVSKSTNKKLDQKDSALETSHQSNQKSSHSGAAKPKHNQQQKSSKIRDLFVPRISDKNATTINSKK